MLVLSRKLNESLTLDGGIVVTVCRIEAGKVRIGITAPRHIGVLRTELIETDDKRNRARVEYEPRIVSVRKVIEAVKN